MAVAVAAAVGSVAATATAGDCDDDDDDDDVVDGCCSGDVKAFPIPAIPPDAGTAVCAGGDVVMAGF